MVMLLITLVRHRPLIGAFYLNLASLQIGSTMSGPPYGPSVSPGSLQRASNALEEAIAWQPNRSIFQWALGKTMLLERDYQSAALALRRSIELEGDHLLAWFDLGNAYEGLGNRSKAVEAWKRARAGSYFREQGWFLFDKLRNYESALKSYQIATQIDPRDWDSWLMLNLSHGQLGHIDEAIRALTVLLGAGDAPDEEIRFKTLMSLANVHSYALGDIEQAMVWYARAIELRPHDVDPYLEAGYIFEMEGRREQARQWYRRAEIANPESERPNLYLGRSYFGEQDEDAVRQLMLAMAKAPMNQEPYFYLGLIYERQGDLVEAEKRLRQAVALIPTESSPQAFAIPYHRYLASTLADQGKREEAIEEYRYALSLDPGNDGVVQELMALLEGVGD